MRSLRIKQVIALVVLLSIAGLAQAFVPTSRASFDDHPVDLPSPACDSLQVSPDQFAFHAYAIGVQIYRWNGTAWVFVEPRATLYADADYHGKVGTHYVGPTWESNSGGKVVATRVTGCTPDPTAIAWLKLQAVSNEGPGIFDAVTFIQRVNTVGGIPPIAPGASVGAIAEVPYTAEYFFYRNGN